MKFLMDYDNIPGKGPKMLFKDNLDGTISLATPEDVEQAIKEALDSYGDERLEEAIDIILNIKSQGHIRTAICEAIRNLQSNLKKGQG